jgi:hypothetical protein
MQLHKGQVWGDRHKKRQGRTIRIDGFQGQYAVCTVLTGPGGDKIDPEEVITVRKDNFEGRWEFVRQEAAIIEPTIAGMEDWYAANPVVLFSTERGIGHVELAAVCGVSYSGLNRWLRGSTPRKIHGEKLAAAMEISYDELKSQLAAWKDKRPTTI